MNIHIATDHAGFALKETLLAYVRDELGHTVHDHGAYAYDEHDDYPPFMAAVAQEVAKDASARGIILGGSGQGEAMVANRTRGVRAAVYYGGPFDIVRLSREHNDANILSLGARFLSEEDAKTAVRMWLGTDFSHEERHRRRIAQIDAV
ncbi:ribose-5-phosphate isomerase [Candidatus Kaiserbacteria bacterium RIFCSPHIGHO2_02_FULL_50_50]|uniref:Ribose-5-phosphate isomerase n=1 Tax=Candidatus Kaiserbacteria bacterium RIFCSPHIGHO2_02_FULL_50_50 TaxID=1798492 RepID=A0A1F6DF17_9BACT|nr:MAG: ribose-5-phosphate isomerase [Candidatus Kaiserbacteria bacterium RIFCSPHIGHO2_02_FULL_50_50]OGG88672.1 MAG: ribose-5-phosphate isomerase [Candidatus Kaiserbacteria bacterium RIFCSPLOWO2_12_FULL_50_10]